jgi:alpha-L-fucosidase 2
MTPWSRSTAESWGEGVLVGTGVVGVVISGGPTRHALTIAHERFFVPANSRRPAPDLAPVLRGVRAALEGGDSAAAADQIESRLVSLGLDPSELVWTDPLAPLAELSWQLEGAASHYRRDLPADDLGATVSWRRDGSPTSLRVDAVHGEGGVDLVLSSDAAITGRLSLGVVATSAANATTVATIDYSDSVCSAASLTPMQLVLRVAATQRAGAPGLSAVVTVTSPEPRPIEGSAWLVDVGPSNPARFRIDVVVDGVDSAYVDPLPNGALAGSRLTIGQSTDEARPTEDLWKAARAGDQDATDLVLETAYAAGRRNVIASTGALPPTLQGVWQGTWAPAWSADYTMNGNLQLGAFAGALWTGNPELLRSLFRLVTPFAEHYRHNARAIFGAPGMLLPARLTTHGHANHFLRGHPHQFWIGHGPWLLRLAADYVQVTGDRSILDEWLWQFTTEIVEFSLAVLADGDGHLVPSYSPENTPHGHDNPLVVDATADIAALRDGLRVSAWLARLHGEPLCADAWERARDELPPFVVSAEGMLAEWDTRWPEQLAHRHASQLHGLWYELDERFESPALRSAALETIRAKIAWRAADPAGPPGRMEMAFGLSSLGIAAAHLGDSEAAYQCALWLARDHFTPALTTTHDAGAIFNVDAAGALPGIVAALLLDSRLGELALLPAVPSAWPSGSITGLTARGGWVIPVLEWSPENVRVELRARPGTEWLRPGTTRIRLPRPGRMLPVAGVSQLESDLLEVTAGLDEAVIEIESH